MSTDEKYEVGKFYWVWIVLDPDAQHKWGNDTMPARFAGYSETGEELWNFLNPDATEWPVRWSSSIAPPVSVGSVNDPEFGALLEFYGRMYPQGDMGKTAEAKMAIIRAVRAWGEQQYQAGYKRVEDGAYQTVLEGARVLAERLEQSEKALAIAMEVVALHQN